MLDKAAEELGQKRALLEAETAMRTKWPTAVRLSPLALKSRFPKLNLLAGWHLFSKELGTLHDLLLLIPEFFPYDLPKVALAEHPTAGVSLPHVEADGMLCLVPNHSPVDLPVDIRHVEFVIREAVNLLQHGLSSANHEDFLDEASIYWVLDQLPFKNVWSIIQKLDTSCVIKGIELKKALVVGDDDVAVRKWLTSTKLGSPKNPLIKVAFIHLSQPLYPINYPTNSAELLALVTTAGKEAIAVLTNVMKSNERTNFNGVVNIILAFDYAGKKSLLGLNFKIIQKGKLSSGFRQGKILKEVLWNRVAENKFRVNRIKVTSIDGNSLLKRTAGEKTLSFSLASARVAVIGCGALGSTVARLLAQSGIRDLTFIDNEKFEWQNVGRHELSGSYVGMSKAVAIQTEILFRFPDYTIKSHPSRWEELWKKNPAEFDQYDLVLSLTGDWKSNHLLNRLNVTGTDIPPIIFGWVEAYALVGHALAVLPNGGCLQCVFSSFGECQYAVAQVSSEYGLVRENSCGTFYQPFSVVAAMPAAAMVAKMALDVLQDRLHSSERRIWISARDEFDTVNASITPEWASKLAKDGHERVYRLPLHPVENCLICK